MRRRILACGLLGMLVLLTAGAVVVAEERPDGIVETTGEYSISGYDPVKFFADQEQTRRRLVAERAAVPTTPGISIQLTSQDRVDIGDVPCDDCGNMQLQLRPGKKRVGVVKAAMPVVEFVNLQPGDFATSSFARGGLKRTEDGFVWTLGIDSDEASALRVNFENVDLPPGTELFVYGAAGQAAGPIKGFGPHGDGEFWSGAIVGSQVYVQLRYVGDLDAASIAEIRFEIPQVAHLGNAFIEPIYGTPDPEPTPDAFCSYNASCVENANCTSSSAVTQARDGFAHMQWISGPYLYICTGGLVNDTDTGTQVPLFLTANHCISKGRDARSLETYWQYDTPCNGGSCDQAGYLGNRNVPTAQPNGARVLSSSRTGDYTLMELNGNPPSGSYFIGFSNAAVAGSNGTTLHRISYPGGGPQAYSRHSVDTSAGQCQGVPRGDWIYSRDTVGATEGGSSGAPVLNGSGQIVGQLTGACGTNTGNVCDSNSNATIDGALASYYSNIATWLDPSDGGGDPPGGSCDNDNVCESGEDCTNCGDCSGKTNGPRSGRYCCGDGTAQSAEGNGSICDGNY